MFEGTMSGERAFAAARSAAELTDDPQARNVSWWERLPMTYKPWEMEDRDALSAEDFATLNALYLDDNPWLKANAAYHSFAGKDVLEIGCGAGSAACLFAKAGARITGIDITEKALSIAQANVRSQKLENNVRLLHMDAEKMHFPDASFDHVYSWGVIHHSRDPSVIMHQIARVLRPGGTGMIMVYNRRSLRYVGRGLWWLIARGRFARGETLETVQANFTDGYYHKHYARAELAEALGAAGLRVESVEPSHMAKPFFRGLPRPVDAFLKRHWGWLLVARFSRP